MYQIPHDSVSATVVLESVNFNISKMIVTYFKKGLDEINNRANVSFQHLLLLTTGLIAYTSSR